MRKMLGRIATVLAALACAVLGVLLPWAALGALALLLVVWLTLSRSAAR